MGRMTSHKLCFNCWVDKKNVGGIPTPLKNMSSSVGMMKFPMYGKYKKRVPNHQPGIHCRVYGRCIHLTC